MTSNDRGSDSGAPWSEGKCVGKAQSVWGAWWYGCGAGGGGKKTAKLLRICEMFGMCHEETGREQTSQVFSVFSIWVMIFSVTIHVPFLDYTPVSSNIAGWKMDPD